MFKQYPSRSGSISASYGGRQLHSSFDPEREAERFLQKELPELPPTVVIIGPGLGYLALTIRKSSPQCRVISMFLSGDSHRHAVETGDEAWDPGSEQPPAAFLGFALDELESTAVAVIEWPPAVACFPGEAAQVRTAVGTVIRQHQASLLTEGASGRRWFSNLVRNYPALSRPVSPQPAKNRPVKACVIAAAGPSLEESLPEILPFRDEISLWVLGSALEAVLAHGLCPDLLVSTDSAAYASEYLRSALRGTLGRTLDGARSGETEVPVAAPLTASRGIGDTSPVWPLTQNDTVERMLYDGLATGPAPVSAHGTVAGTALGLALSVQEWPVIVVGMDLAWHGVRSHARPHVVQVYHDLAASRLTPPLTALYREIRQMTPLDDGWATSGPLEVYANWFQNRYGGKSGRVYGWGPSPLASIDRKLDATTLGGLTGRYPSLTFTDLHWPATADREKSVRTLVGRCRTALTGLADAETPADPLQMFLLRRLALESLLRWHRSGLVSDLHDGSLKAIAALDRIGEASRE